MKLGCFVFVHFIFNSLLNKTREKTKNQKGNTISQILVAVSAVDFGTKYCMLHASCAYFIIHTCSQLDVNSILLYMDTACVQTKSTLNVCAFRCDEKVSSISTVSV